MVFGVLQWVTFWGSFKQAIFDPTAQSVVGRDVTQIIEDSL